MRLLQGFRAALSVLYLVSATLAGHDGLEPSLPRDGGEEEAGDKDAESCPSLAAAESLVSSAIGASVDSCLREVEVGGARLRLRIPFGENGERTTEGGFVQAIAGGGKESPGLVWKRVEAALASEDFATYLEALAPAGPKAVTFNLAAGAWAVDATPGAAGALRGGNPEDAARPRGPASIHVAEAGGPPRASTVYNYLYCVAAAGLDCSGFVFGVQADLARAFGLDLEGLYASEPGRRGAGPGGAGGFRRLAGLWLFDPANGYSEPVEPRPLDLRPGDIFLFRGHLGEFSHSAVIRSVDRNAGVIRYAQCTDWAPRDERGVHESFVLFDARKPDQSLDDPAIHWTQSIGPAFEGEPDPPWWRDDGERFRAAWPTGRSLVVRLKAVRDAIETAIPGFYSARPTAADPAILPR